eukprot:bmy_09096T0
MKATPLEQMKQDYLYIMETKNKGVDKSRKRFGPHVPTLLEARDDAYRCGHFTYKPIGSSGACIHLWDPELALAIESCLNGLLQAYCCHNHAERMLQALMKRRIMLDTELLIIQFPTVLTDLEIENAVVANSLTDMRGIETVLLVKNNCAACAVFVGHYYLSENIRPKFLSRDVDLFQTDLEKEDENKVKIKIRKSISKMWELENIEELQSADVATLEDEAQENKIKMKIVEKNMEQQKENMEHLKNDAIKLKINQLADPLKDESNPVDSEVDNQKQEKWHFEEKQKEHLDTLTKKKQELDMKEKELEEKMSQKRKINLPRADRRKKQCNRRYHLPFLYLLLESRITKCLNGFSLLV